MKYCTVSAQSSIPGSDDPFDEQIVPDELAVIEHTVFECHCSEPLRLVAVLGEIFFSAMVRKKDRRIS